MFGFPNRRRFGHGRRSSKKKPNKKFQSFEDLDLSSSRSRLNALGKVPFYDKETAESEILDSIRGFSSSSSSSKNNTELFNQIPDPDEIKTYAFFKLNTTGLPNASNNYQVEIKEITILALSKIYLFARDFNPSNVNKLTMFFNPKNGVGYEITGLTDEMLLRENEFNSNSADCIAAFLDDLPKPMCLVAHNGSEFHFPLLKDAFLKFNKKLPDGICYVDSLLVFRNIKGSSLKAKHKCEKLIKQRIVNLNNYDWRSQPYKLSNAYTIILERPIPTFIYNSAEADLILLRELITFYGRFFINYVEGNKTRWEDNVRGFTERYSHTIRFVK